MRGMAFGILCGATAWLAPSHARAFERERHVGGGVGITAYPHYYGAGPSLGLHAGYGISDVFDLKLELLGSSHSYSAGGTSPSGARAGVLGSRLACRTSSISCSGSRTALRWSASSTIAGPLPASEPFSP